jgi:hypothetical protein
VETTNVVGRPLVITNRVLDPVASTETPPGPVGEMVSLHRSLVAEQQRWLAALVPDLTLPYLFGLFTPGEVSAHISDALEVLA